MMHQDVFFSLIAASTVALMLLSLFFLSFALFYIPPPLLTNPCICMNGMDVGGCLPKSLLSLNNRSPRLVSKAQRIFLWKNSLHNSSFFLARSF